MKRVLLLAVLAGGLSAHAQETDEQITLPETSDATSAVQQMAMPTLPTTLQFSQLSKSWRRFTVQDLDPNTARMYGGNAAQMEQVFSDLGIGVHFTKGDNLTLGKETYLVAYRVDPGLDPQDLQQEIQQRLQALWGHGEQAPPPRPAGKFSPRSTLKLSLLNLRNLGDLQDLRAFDAKTDLLSPKDLREMSNFNLRRMGQIMREYSRHQGLPLRDVAALRQMMRNQHAPVTLLREPASNETYHLNTALNGKKPDRVGNRKNLVVMYEAAASTDNTRGVLFADWHVERVPEWKWAQVRAVKLQKPTNQEYRVLSAQQLKNLFNYLNSFLRRGSAQQFKDSQTVRTWMMNNWGHVPQMYQSPASGQWYLFNTKLSGIAIQEVTNKNQVVAIYEPELGSDGKRGAIFLDGVVRRVAAKDWKRALAIRPRLTKPKNERRAQLGNPLATPNTTIINNTTGQIY